ncbi:MAG: dTMP kinase [Methanobacteriota archaeon]
MRGLFITVEGIDGCGKSTFVKALAKALLNSNHKVVVTREPTGTWLGDAVRRSWDDRSGPYVEAYLFMADRVVHCTEIAKETARGRIVISDRYHDSTLAYQGSALAPTFPGGLGGALAWLKQASPPSILTPDVTFFLKLEPQTSMKRMAGRPSRTKFERLAYLRRVHAAYMELSKERRFVTLDSTNAIDNLVIQAIDSLERMKLLKATTKIPPMPGKFRPKAR